MISESKAQKITIEMLNELYENCTPPIPWAMVEFLYGGTGVPFYEKHIIEENKYNQIVEKYKKKLGPFYGKRIGMDLLNYGPKVKYDENKK